MEQTNQVSTTTDDEVVFDIIKDAAENFLEHKTSFSTSSLPAPKPILPIPKKPLVSPTVASFYKQKVAFGRLSPDELARIRGMVAWTWLPGRSRRECPRFVDMNDARVVTMDYFSTIDETPRAILSMHRVRMDRTGMIRYASPQTLALFKDYGAPPRYSASGLVVDSRNEEVCLTALALENALMSAAKHIGNYKLKSFDPPPLLLGFPMNYVPYAAWRIPMQLEAIRYFLDDAPTLQCLCSSGGTVTDIHEEGEFRVTTIQKGDGQQMSVRAPIWTIVPENVQVGSVLAIGQPFADLPRRFYLTPTELSNMYSIKSMEWLATRILQEHTEIIEVDDCQFDINVGKTVFRKVQWRTCPIALVETQLGRARKFLLDMRGHLGRQIQTRPHRYDPTFSLNLDYGLVRIDVHNIGHVPSILDGRFGDSVSWSADFFSPPKEGPLTSTVHAVRGISEH